MDKWHHLPDCSGRLIFFQEVYENTNRIVKLSNDFHQNALNAIIAPTVLIEYDNDRTRYYYKIMRGLTLLIGVCFINGIWKVTEYIENPTSQTVRTVAHNYLLDTLNSEDQIK